MAAVVPFASCYAVSTVRPLQLFDSPEMGYLSFLSYHGPRGAPKVRMAYRGPRMTLRQICRMLRMMRQVHGREAGTGMTRKQAAPSERAAASQVSKAAEKRCLSACFRRRRSSNLKRVG